MSDEANIFSTLSQILLKITSISKCIKADQNAPAPAGSYATIRVFDNCNRTLKPYLDYRNLTNDQGQKILASDLKISLTTKVHINFYRENARENAKRIVGCSYIPSVNEIIAKNKIAILEYSDVINTSMLQSHNTEERATITLNVAFESIYTEETKIIESTKITVKSNKTIIEETIFPTEEQHGL